MMHSERCSYPASPRLLTSLPGSVRRAPEVRAPAIHPACSPEIPRASAAHRARRSAGGRPASDCRAAIPAAARSVAPGCSAEFPAAAPWGRDRPALPVVRRPLRPPPSDGRRLTSSSREHIQHHFGRRSACDRQPCRTSANIAATTAGRLRCSSSCDDPRQIWRSTSFNLRLAIASDGFSPFGQALAQFMMVWQR